ncbi:four helix bundle protein [Urechidicola croceus]|uniref:Four helix bundle protein n=1 Tax=Urechidicola croceus TaxID=1850246 RepID=A0A1D8P6R0_9FLAO|nr:four helix bundle protein [Urechidicola croceus]AOW20261.1 four helix bundle protein [Urechidicola croceus]
MHNFKELNVWKEAKDFSVEVFKITNTFPKSELYGITSQINRASVSIPSNIAEGASRKSDKDFSRFIQIALGSSFELETQLIISNEINYLDEITFNKVIEQLNKIQKMLFNFNRHLQNK